MGYSRAVWTVLLPMAACLLGGCRGPRLFNPALSNLDAVLWVQTAAEYEAACLAAFRNAKETLEYNITNGAVAVVGGDAATKATVVVLDIDETVLSNIPFQGECIRRGTNFDAILWKRWVESAQATALRGAVDFCQFATGRQAKLVYITNRGEASNDTERSRQKAATQANLEKLGFPVEGDLILMPGDKPEWTTDKTSRRNWVDERYRAVTWIGDDLGDFVTVTNLTVEGRLNLVKEHESKWGSSWFILPNPMYGSWLRSLTQKAPADPFHRQRWKLGQLRSMESR